MPVLDLNCSGVLIYSVSTDSLHSQLGVFLDEYGHSVEIRWNKPFCEWRRERANRPTRLRRAGVEFDRRCSTVFKTVDVRTIPYHLVPSCTILHVGKMLSKSGPLKAIKIRKLLI